MTQLAISNLHLVDSSGNVLLENAQESIINSRFNLGVFTDMAALMAAHVAPLQHSEAYLIEEQALVRWVGSSWVYEVSRGHLEVLDNTTTQIQSKFGLEESALQIAMLVEQGSDRMLKTFHILGSSVYEGMSMGIEFTQFSVEHDETASTASGLHTINLVGTGTGISTSIKWIAKKVF